MRPSFGLYSAWKFADCTRTSPMESTDGAAKFPPTASEALLVTPS